MTEIVNTAQSAAWNGYEGDHWAANHDRYDAVNSGFNEPLLVAAHIARGDRVLDIGCGNGQLTRLAAQRAAAATGVDLSGPMLARAREQAGVQGVDNVSFIQGDAQVHPFPNAAFDVALSRFGIMFFADPVVAFANIARALRPGGRLAFVSMTALPDSATGRVFGAAAAHLPDFEISPSRNDFADPDTMRRLLTTAGFTRVDVRRVEADSTWGADITDATRFVMDWGPVRYHRGLREFAADEQVRAAIARALEPFVRHDGVHLSAAAWLVTATKPLP
ncbi:SAM-dependent methyltransferase [Nocardia panacis]|uniref:SAM-dependent methyltransferase n=1 Tax=Nocardia panacis TaxID=2340916 RepID=A0A3A4JIV6_9NOCA|nr:class I SAM-dependent methyltransferase [Nocardia panacis]RJO68347.1 SAM-dependent methyltransferase [Nocardia panacis]